MTVRRRSCCCGGIQGPCLDFWRQCLGNDPRTVAIEFQSRFTVQQFATCDDGTLSSEIISEGTLTFNASAVGKWLGDDSNFLSSPDCAISVSGSASASSVYRTKTYTGQSGICPTYADCYEEERTMAEAPCFGILRYGSGFPNIPHSVLVALYLQSGAQVVYVQRFIGVCGTGFNSSTFLAGGEVTASSKELSCQIDPQAAGGYINLGSGNSPLQFQDFQIQQGDTLYRNTGSVTVSPL